MKTLLIIDSHSILFKAHFGFGRNQLKNSKGMTTSALYGFLRTFNALLNQFNPNYLCFAFDKSRQTFRRKIYSEYKAHRGETPPELKEQLPYAYKIAEALDARCLMLDDFEADDILGSVSAQFCHEPELKVYLITGDRDSFQLIKDNVFVGYTSSKVKNGVDIYDPERIMEKYGLTPQKLIQVKALQGDTSDNIPGVRGVGEKTALKFVKEYTTLDNLYENIEQIKGKMKEKLLDGKDDAYLSEELARIRTDIDLPFTLQDLQWEKKPTAAFKELLKEMEFYSLLKSFFPDMEAEEEDTQPEKTAPAHEKHYQTILTQENLDKVLAEIKAAPLAAIDVETNKLDSHSATLVGVSLSTKEHHGYYLPISHSYLGAPKQLKLEAIKEFLQKCFEDTSKKWVGHNLKFDITILNNHGINFPENFSDTMILAHLLYPTRRMGLKNLAYDFLNIERPSFEDLVGKNGDFRTLQVEQATLYAAADADDALCLYNLFSEKFKDEPELKQLASNIELPLVKVLLKMEQEGIHINTAHFEKLASEFSKHSDALKKKILEIANCEFNLNSPKQLSEVLFEKLEIPPLKKTKTGYSTATDVLEKLAPEYPICELITEYRHMQKLLSTYVTPLPTMTDKEGRIHTSFNQTVVATGRLSSTHPNLQNIPVRSHWGHKIREGFIPSDKNSQFVSIDYSCGYRYYFQ